MIIIILFYFIFYYKLTFRSSKTLFRTLFAAAVAAQVHVQVRRPGPAHKRRQTPVGGTGRRRGARRLHRGAARRTRAQGDIHGGQA